MWVINPSQYVVGSDDGSEDADGAALGSLLGNALGIVDGRLLGSVDGVLLGRADGCAVGDVLGTLGHFGSLPYVSPANEPVVKDPSRVLL